MGRRHKGPEKADPKKCLHKKKGASRKARAKLDVHFQLNKSGGVNPPIFQIYFCRRIRSLAGIE